MDLVGALVKESLPELFTEGQVVAAEQQFERRLAEYEMNIEQQKLFREDLRDLVELTVGRMDIYHLVGALLLEFCIHFYCENEMLESDELPAWVSTIFLLSNLAATGYLVFAVWLSMHASVASHSVGVRLLTRFARLSIPSRKELENVAKAPLMPIMERFKRLGTRIRGKGEAGGAGEGGVAAAASSSSSATPAVRQRNGTGSGGSETEVASAQPSLRRPRVSFSCPEEVPAPAPGAAVPPVRRSSSGSSEFSGAGLAIEEGERAQEDRQRHFRRFLREQRRWLCYDAYARVCMSLGMNQMLAALSYYIVGKVAMKAPGAAVVTLLGLQVISVLLLRLDVTQGFHAKKEAITLICFVPLPPIYIGTITWIARSNPDFHRVMLSYLFLPGYLLHGGWLFIIALCLTGNTDDVLAIPRRLRTVLYLDVLHLEQGQVANAVIAQESRGLTDELRACSNELEEDMKVVVKQEQEVGALSSARRKNPELMMLKDHLEELVDEVRTRTLGSTEPQLRKAAQEARRVEWILERLEVWQAAPEVEASLQALQNFQVKSFLSEKDQELIERAQADFLQLCRDLDLGICAREPAAEDGAAGQSTNTSLQPSTSRVTSAQSRNSAGSTALSTSNASASDGHKISPMEVDPAEWPKVRVQFDYGDDSYEPTSVWIQPSDSHMAQVEHTAPSSLERTTDVGAMLEGTLPAWRSHAEHLLQEPRSPRSIQPSSGIQEAVPPLPEGAAAPMRPLGGKRSSSLASTWESSEQPLMPAHATPPEQLPRVIVKRFTLTMAILWLASGAWHLGELLSGHASEAQLEQLSLGRELTVSWPEPARLFDVASLHCNGSVVVVDSGFSLYVAERTADRLGPLNTIGETGAQALICGPEGCDVLTSSGVSQEGILQILPLMPHLGAGNASLPLRAPPAWRRIAAALAPCSPAPCETLALAGWDGAQVVVARAWRRTHSDLWQVQSRFAVRPGRAGCTRQQQVSTPCSSLDAGAGEEYREVKALQLGAGGRSLTVLYGQGMLDGWDLAAGVRVGRWNLASNALAMCHDDRELLLAHEGGDDGAVVLEALPLPHGLAQLGRPGPGKAEGIEQKKDDSLQWTPA